MKRGAVVGISLFSLFSLGLAACAGASAQRGGHGDQPVRSGGAGPAASGSAITGSSAPSPALLQRLEALSRQMERDGVRFRGVLASGFITSRTAVTTPVDVAAGTCLSIVTVTSAGIRDVDARLYGPDGDLLAEDAAEDPHPTVQLCASEARRVYHEFDGYDGHGAYAIGAFVTDRRGLEVVARVVGGRPGTAVSGAAVASDAERRLAELREGIARRGFVPSGDVIRAPFAAAGALRFPITVNLDRCYTLAALADGSLTDTDLSVFDADGEEIARDIRPERDAFVQLCPSIAGPLSVEVRGRPGPGVVLLQQFAADAAAVGGANTLWLGERVAWGASAVTLAQALDATRRGLATEGYTAVEPINTVPFATGELREARVTLEGGRCTAVTAIAGRGLGRLRLEVRDGAGALLARGVPRGPATVAVLCPGSREEVVTRTRAEVGTGDAALGQFRGTAAPSWSSGIDRAAVTEAMSTQLATAAGGWRAEGTPERFRIGARAVRSHEFDLAAGTCTRLGVSAGGSLPLVALNLRASNGQTVAQGSGEGTAIVTRCARSLEHVRLEATIDPPGVAEYDAVWMRFVRADHPAGER